MNAPRAAILSVGDELVLGTTLDTNSRTLSAALREAGLDVVEHRTVADDRVAIAAAMRALASSVDVLVSTGGLGPTDDDLTRDALNDLTDAGGPQVEDAVARTDLDAWFAGRGRTMAAINLRQALRPKSARIVRNLGGTAPGLSADGSVTLFGAVRPGEQVQLCYASPEGIVRDARAIGDRLRETGFTPAAGLVISCAGRKHVAHFLAESREIGRKDRRRDPRGHRARRVLRRHVGILT